MRSNRARSLCVLAKLYKTFASSQIGSPFPVYNSLQLLLSLPRTSISLSQDSTLYIEHYSGRLGRLGRLSVLVAVTQVYPISYSTYI
jgi:hypothetical protein